MVYERTRMAAQSLQLSSRKSVIEAQDEHNPHPSEEEIKGFMESLGYTPLQDCVTKWKKDRVIVSDAREHNFIKSATGLIPIDLLINKLVDCD